MGENIKVEVKTVDAQQQEHNVKIFIDDNEYDSGKRPDQFGDWTFDVIHKQRGWLLNLGEKCENSINDWG